MADAALAQRLAEAAKSAPPFDAHDRLPEHAQHDVHRHLRRAGGAAVDKLERALRRALERDPHAAVVRGLPPDESCCLLVGLSWSLGVCLGTTGEPHHHAVRRVQPASESRASSALRLQEALHTDGTNWPMPNDFTLLHCIRADGGGGGRSRVLSATALACAVEAQLGSAVLNVARELPLPWAVAAELGGGVHWRAPLGEGVRWLRYTIDMGAELVSERPVHDVLRLVDALEGVIDETTPAEFALEPGDTLVIDNRRCLHGRSPIESRKSERLLLRTKVRRVDRR
jgi:alpha-ketoglutarate-dependent taurine dioxygenase